MESKTVFVLVLMAVAILAVFSTIPTPSRSSSVAEIDSLLKSDTLSSSSSPSPSTQQDSSEPPSSSSPKSQQKNSNKKFPPPPAPRRQETRQERIDKNKDNNNNNNNKPADLLEEQLTNKEAYRNWLLDSSQKTFSESLENRSVFLPMAIALRQRSRQRTTSTQFYSDKQELICALLMMQTGNCRPFTESVADCVFRIGKENFEPILPTRCTLSRFWKILLPDLMKQNSDRFTSSRSSSSSKRLNWKQLKRGTVFDSQWKRRSEEKTRYIPPEERNIAPFPPRRVCKSGCVSYPISFALPRAYFVEKVPRSKNFEWMPLMPKATPARGRYELHTTDEELFKQMYSQSFFGWAHRRGGFASMRQHEVLAAGSIPYFYDLETFPEHVEGHLPKELLKKARRLPGVDHIARAADRSFMHNEFVRPSQFDGINFEKNGNIVAEKFDMNEYYKLADEIHAYAKKYVTAEAVASYMLKTLKAEDARNILFMSRGSVDYQETTILLGLSGLGINVTFATNQEKSVYFKMHSRVGEDGEEIPPTIEEREKILLPHDYKLYAHGTGFALRVNDDVVKSCLRQDDEAMAKIGRELDERKYDVVLYGTHPWNKYDMIEKVLAKKDQGVKVGFIQWRDWHNDPDANTLQACLASGGHGPVFVREMSDRKC